MNEEIIILFDQYLAGELDTQAMESFNKRLAEDKQLKESFNLYQSMNDYLDDTNTHESALHTLKNIHLSETKAKKSTHYLWWVLLLVLLGLTILYWVFKPNVKSQEEQFFAYYEEPTWPSTRSDAKPLELAIHRFINEHAQLGINQLRKDPNIGQYDKNLWLAEMYLHEQKPDSCLLYLKQVNVPDNLRDRKLYMEALCYWLKRDNVSLNKIKETLPKDLDPYYLGKIKELRPSSDS